MEIVEIYEGWLYSIQFDEEDLNEYARVFKEWHDLDYLEKFFTDNADYINTPFWKDAGLDPNEPEASALKVLNEAEELEDYIMELVSNMKLGIKPDFDEYFHFLDGKYKCLWTLEPMKSYGTGRPSIQNSPVLKDKVFNKIDNVLNYLRANGIEDSEDI